MRFFVAILLLLALALALGGCLPGVGEQKVLKIDPVWSPDGTKVAFTSNEGGNWNIYLIDLETDEVRRLTDGSANEASPSWSPDGSRIVFSSDQSGEWEIYTMKADGTEVRQLTAKSPTLTNDTGTSHP